MTDRAELFREEVFEARKMRLQGEVLLSRPLRAHAIVGLLTSTVAAISIWIGTGSYARTEPAKGLLVTDAGVAKIVALHPGIITRFPVIEGQLVHKGQALATIQVDQSYAEGGRATQEGLNAVGAQQQLASGQVGTAQVRGQSERTGFAATITSTVRQYSDVEGQLVIQEQLVQSLQGTFERYRPVAEKGFITQTEMDRRQQELLTARQELGRLRQQLTTLQADRARAQAQLRQSQAEEETQTANARSSAEGFRAQQAQLRGEQSYVLTAPADGIVTAVQSGVGRTVDPSVPLMTIVPKDAILHAELYAPSRAIGFVKSGEEVRLLYDAFPYQRFGTFRGRIQAISRVALDPGKIDAPFKIDEPVYRVSVIPDQQTVSGFGESVRLQPGMTLSANIILERRSFLGWLLEPLSAVSRRDH